MSADDAGEQTGGAAGGERDRRRALVRGLLAEAVDCIAQAGRASGDEATRATLRRHADELAELADQLRTSSDGMP